MIDEGYIKFQCHWEKATASQKDLSELIHWRNKLFQMGLIGHYPDINVGFGNISQKMEGKQFIISGTQTGHIEHIQPEHFTDSHRLQYFHQRSMVQRPGKSLLRIHDPRHDLRK